MDFSDTFKVCASGFTAQRAKMDVIVTNLANVNTTRTPEGGPYKRKVVVFSAEPVTGSFDNVLDASLQAVRVDDIVEDEKGVKTAYDPNHPDADESGFVSKPDINSIIEMSDMIAAHRAYEACVTVFDATKNMALKTLDIGK
jgi:flagellar basal-body rod protein FlgC